MIELRQAGRRMKKKIGLLDPGASWTRRKMRHRLFARLSRQTLAQDFCYGFAVAERGG